jgi:hypothetical protein
MKGKVGETKRWWGKEGWRVSASVKRLGDPSGQSLLRQGTTKGDFFF